MHEYLTLRSINPLNWILRDAPVFLDEESLKQRRQQELTVAREALSELLGKDTPAIQAVERFGVHALASVKGIQNVQDVFGVDEATARKILALRSLAQHMYVRSKGSLPYVRGLSDVERLCQSMAFQQREEMRVLLVNDDYLLIHEEVVALGEADLLHVTPADILRPALERKVGAFVVVHNHPSGSLEPSPEDLAFTAELRTAANLMKKVLLDHVIISQEGALSCLRALEHKPVDKEG